MVVLQTEEISAFSKLEGFLLYLQNLTGHNETANGARHHAVHTFRQGVLYFQGVIRFYGTLMSVISVTPVRNSTVFHAPVKKPTSVMCRSVLTN
jgi:hypothetical protein